MQKPELAATFDRVAEHYHARPPYPVEVFDLLAERCGLGAGTRVLEIGPGTGQATLPLLERGAEVTAIEPGAALAAQLVRRADVGAGRLQVIASTLEEAVIPPGRFDLVAAATSFHWVDTDRGLDRCAEALRPDGALALWWSLWGDPDRHDPLHEALQPLLRAEAPELLDGSPYQAHVLAIADVVFEQGAFADVEVVTIPWDGHHDALGLRRMFATFSGWIALPEPRRSRLLERLEALVHDQFAGHVVRPYRTVAITARRR